MKKYILILLNVSSLILIGCNQKKSKIDLQSKEIENSVDTNVIENSNIAFLNSDSIEYKIFKNSKSITLSENELIEIERILIECISEHNKAKEIEFTDYKSKYPDHPIKRNKFIIDLSRYKRQYIAVENVHGEREVWINCFCTTMDDGWKKHLFLVNDGGNCFFDLKINLSKKQYYDFTVNGEA